MFQPQGKSDSVETFIGPSVRAEGTFSSAGNVVIEGAFSGTLTTEQDIMVGKNAKITATVHARNIKIAGEVHGDVHAAERLELEVTARVTGDIEAKTIRIAEGALLQGKCTMVKDSAEHESRKPSSSKRILGAEAAQA